MILNGEKFACEACVRGHRVSNCQHHDRPLQHINKKGRPVSQCAHCRSARKNRAAHVKCDCGEKPSKCAHLQPTLEGHRETCCCNHGGRCSCAVKKEPALDTVPESESDGESRPNSCSQKALPPNSKAKLVARRRRAITIHSDGFAFDQNGNFKGGSKHSRAPSRSSIGLNRTNSATDPSSSSSSMSADAAAATRLVKSEAASPMMTGSGFSMLPGLPPLDLSGLDDMSYLSNSGSVDLFGSGVNSEFDAPMYSAGLSAASVDWSNFDLHNFSRDNFTPSSYSQNGAQSFTGLFDKTSSASDTLPALANTTSTSEDVSEAEDFMPGNDADLDSFNTAFVRNALGGGDLSSIDYDSFYKGGDGGMAMGTGISAVEDDPAFYIQNYNDGMAQDESFATNAVGNFWDV